MSELISGVVSQQIQGNQALKQNPTQTPGGKSFETHLQEKMQTSGDQTKTGTPNTQTAGKLEEIQAELQKSTQKSEADTAKTQQILKDLMGESGGRMSMLKEAYNNLKKTNAVPSDLKGNLVNMETEWNVVQQIMNSNKNLTQGELLALQQRLYMVSQHVEVMSKVVDQMAGGIKTVLNTNI